MPSIDSLIVSEKFFYLFNLFAISLALFMTYYLIISPRLVAKENKNKNQAVNKALQIGMKNIDVAPTAGEFRLIIDRSTMFVLLFKDSGMYFLVSPNGLSWRDHIANRSAIIFSTPEVVREVQVCFENERKKLGWMSRYFQTSIQS